MSKFTKKDQKKVFFQNTKFLNNGFSSFNKCIYSLQTVDNCIYMLITVDNQLVFFRTQIYTLFLKSSFQRLYVQYNLVISNV